MPYVDSYRTERDVKDVIQNQDSRDGRKGVDIVISHSMLMTSCCDMSGVLR
jgi:hypothetical protein